MKIKTLLWIPKSAFVPLCLMETLTLGEEPRKQNATGYEFVCRNFKWVTLSK